MLDSWREVMQLLPRYTRANSELGSRYPTSFRHDLHAYVMRRPLIGYSVYTLQTRHYKCLQIIIYTRVVLQVWGQTAFLSQNHASLASVEPLHSGFSSVIVGDEALSAHSVSMPQFAQYNEV